MSDKQKIGSFSLITGLLAVISWLSVCTGLIYEYVVIRGWRTSLLQIGVLLFSAVLSVLLLFFYTIMRAPSSRYIATMEAHAASLDSVPEERLPFYIILGACLSLFMELMMVRYQASVFQLFAYFKNISLLSCFLGLGVGYAMGGRRPLATPVVVPLLALQMVFMHFLRQSGAGFYLQNPVSEQLGLGIGQARNFAHLASAYGFITLIFTVNTLTFIPIGHLNSFLMQRLPKLGAYSFNLIGSLAGIAVFLIVSFLQLPPAVWLMVAVGMLLLLVHKPRAFTTASVLMTGAAALLLCVSLRPGYSDRYSPYQIITLIKNSGELPFLRVNNVYFQKILDFRGAPVFHYELPYRFITHPADVCIVGSGTGNDIAAALKNGAQHIDAVEIDPVVLRLGRMLHPQHPYASEKVQACLNDARAFLRTAARTYDVIVFGLLDSHTLLSGMSSVRLDSYIYTVESFRTARARLKAGGMMYLSFSLLGDQMGRKLYLMLQEAFDGREPLVYQTGYDGGYAFLIGNQPLDSARAALAPGVARVTAFSNRAVRAYVSTDDWPFFYMPKRIYPVSYLVILTLLTAISFLFVTRSASLARADFSLPLFFLGAGFMLIETKGITELALVFGSTWVVVGIVLVAILILGFFANVVIMRWPAGLRPWAGYLLLALCIAAGMFMSVDALGFLPSWLVRAALTFVLLLPLFFSGLLFSTELDRSPQIGTAMASNLLGAMLGGFMEYNAMYFGYKFLYLLAIVMYGCAFAFSRRRIKNLPL